MITKKGDGSQVKESTDSNTTLEDEDVKGMKLHSNVHNSKLNIFLHFWFTYVKLRITYIICSKQIRLNSR